MALGLYTIYTFISTKTLKPSDWILGSWINLELKTWKPYFIVQICVIKLQE